MELAEAKNTVDRAMHNKQMLLVIGNCSVVYEGRARARLDKGDRILVVKKDGCFMVHQPTKLPPVVYHPAGAAVYAELGQDTLTIRTMMRKPKETITVVFGRIDLAQAFDLEDKQSKKLVGMESDLAKELRTDLDVIEPGLRIANHESCLQSGMVDIWAEDKCGAIVLIELKRRTAGLSAVSQLHRYVHEVKRIKGRNVRGILCAPSITPNAKTLLDKEGLEFRKIDFQIRERTEITGLSKKQRGLTDFLK